MTLRNAKKQAEFVRELRELNSVTGVNLFSEEEENGIPVASA